jgi:hypothetical protein
VFGIADMKAARREVQIATGSAKAPGARLHVLTIGFSDYGDKASDLRLKFAHRDAQDVARASHQHARWWSLCRGKGPGFAPFRRRSSRA